MQSSDSLKIKRGSSALPSASAAVSDLHQQIAQADAVLTLLFISPHYDLNALEQALDGVFSGIVIGCTTAGEITHEGFQEQTLTGISLAGDAIHAQMQLIEDLTHFSHKQAQKIGDQLHESNSANEGFDPDRHFALLFIDGLSMREELVVALLHNHLDGVPLIGGSAGDGMAFEQTRVFAHGKFHHDAAVLTIVQCDTPFLPFRLQHFQPTEERLIITESDPLNRRVCEINGIPATEAYAKAVGVAADQLTAHTFSRHPTILRIGNAYYVRSIQKANADGSLTFYSAVEDGLVLHVAEGEDMAKHLKNQLNLLQAEIPNPQLILTCDCILRRLEAKQTGSDAQIAEALAPYPVVGFSTYGEQSGAIHVNQTMTGIVLGG
ncbi:FIST N-terminal domain-containing protein [Magnetococcus sp. PR-3]|uniref:FIST N-terminal domain-containing protein n=1 Tax=Magnetococcus sp. PR-3 TaxID=3120355 RepID=UPI002FCE19A8